MTRIVSRARTTPEEVEFDVILEEDDEERFSAKIIVSPEDCLVDNPQALQRMGITVSDALAMARFPREVSFEPPERRAPLIR